MPTNNEFGQNETAGLLTGTFAGALLGGPVGALIGGGLCALGADKIVEGTPFDLES